MTTSDLVDRDFVQAIGEATISFARIDNFFTQIVLQLRLGRGVSVHGNENTAEKVIRMSFDDKRKEIFKHVPTNGPLPLGNINSILSLHEQVKRIIAIRNFMAHGLFLAAETPGEYRCAMIDRRGRSIEHPISAKSIRLEINRAGIAFDTLRNVLLNAGIIDRKIQVGGTKT